MMALASLLAVLFTTAGLALSYAPDLPAGATTIVIAGAAYLLVLALRRVASRVRG
jgi:zinc transport system permease protein